VENRGGAGAEVENAADNVRFHPFIDVKSRLIISACLFSFVRPALF
jgi:hypothetical protein